jgi:hypothetical protein
MDNLDNTPLVVSFFIYHADVFTQPITTDGQTFPPCLHEPGIIHLFTEASHCLIANSTCGEHSHRTDYLDKPLILLQVAYELPGYPNNCKTGLRFLAAL